MKKWINLLSLLLCTVIFCSCEENVSPKGELPEIFSVNMIIRSDTTLQTASVSKAYDVEGFNPSELKLDPAISGSKATLKYTDTGKEYLYRDTVDNDQINQRFGTPSRYLYLKNFPIRYGKEVELRVQIQNGKLLTSKTKIPDMFTINSEYTTPFIPGPFLNQDTANINVALNNAPSELAKMSKVRLVYFYKELDGTKTRYEVSVPLNQIIVEGDTTLNYVSSSYRNEIKISRQLLKKTMFEISKGNSSKGRYSIAPLVVDIYLLDENLTRYFSAGLFIDYGFTIRNIPGILSNISGGLGFFGSYIHSRLLIRFEDQYLLNTFGYLRER
jgi:hypothetical protein